MEAMLKFVVTFLFLTGCQKLLKVITISLGKLEISYLNLLPGQLSFIKQTLLSSSLPYPSEIG
jgi:hypothetical protein